METDFLDPEDIRSMLRDTLEHPWAYRCVSERLRELEVMPTQPRHRNPETPWVPHQHPIRDWHRFRQSSRSHIAIWEEPPRTNPSAAYALWAAILNSITKPLPIFRAGACCYHAPFSERVRVLRTKHPLCSWWVTWLSCVGLSLAELDSEDAQCTRRETLRLDLEPLCAQFALAMATMDPDLADVILKARSEAVRRRIEDERWLLQWRDSSPIVPGYMTPAAADRHWPLEGEAHARAMGL